MQTNLGGGQLKVHNCIQQHHCFIYDQKESGEQMLKAKWFGATRGIEYTTDKVCKASLPPNQQSRELECAETIARGAPALFDIIRPHIVGEAEIALTIDNLEAIASHLDNLEEATQLAHQLTCPSAENVTGCDNAPVFNNANQMEKEVHPLPEESMGGDKVVVVDTVLQYELNQRECNSVTEDNASLLTRLPKEDNAGCDDTLNFYDAD